MMTCSNTRFAISPVSKLVFIAALWLVPGQNFAQDIVEKNLQGISVDSLKIAPKEETKRARLTLQSEQKSAQSIPIDSAFHESKKERNPLIYIAPAALVGLGIFTLTDNGVFSRQTVKQWRDDNLNGFHTTADDYLQYAPAVIALGLKALGVKNEHTWAHTIELLVKLEVITTLLVTGMKYTINEQRPDSDALNAFPSGHTAQAFAAATFLHKEFGRGRPWISVASYAMATSVGVLRVFNNRHWVSDTLTGAGLGILVTNLVYALDEKDREKKRKIRLSVGQLPTGGPSVGLSIPIGK